MIIKYDGQDYPVDIDEIDIDEYRQLKTKYAMTPKGFQEAINEGDPDASTFLYWLMLRRAGQPGVILGNHLKPNVTRLNAAMVAAAKQEEEEEEARRQAGLEAAAAEVAAAVPTRTAVPPSSAPPSPADTTPTPPLVWIPAEGSSSGSGPATSAPSGTSTSSSSQSSAGSLPPTSGG